jgi:hypothetical protein
MPVSVTWRQALAWRMRRHFLDSADDPPIESVVARLCGVQAQVAASAELAIRVRSSAVPDGGVERALSDGRLIRTWAMRGTLHLLTPDVGAALLSVVASGRSWERPAWQRYFGVSPAEIEALRGVVREVLDGQVLTREELVAAVVRRPGFEHIGDALRSGWGTLLKPLAWQGDLCHGPSRGNRVTFMLPEAASRHWAGIPDPAVAVPRAIVAYVGAYGPATIKAFSDWLAGGWFGTRQLRGWLAALGDRLTEVEVDGEPAYVLAEDVDDLAATRPTDVVRLLPGFDQYVLGPGTADGHVTPAARRRDVSRQSGWIAPVVVAGGAVSGTWALDGDVVRVAWFAEAGVPPGDRLEAEVSRLSGILGRTLRTAVGPA